MNTATQHIRTAACEQNHRAERVTWLLAGVVGLSMADLFLTISYLT
ncbi:MAG: hypothetical protein HOH93_04030, partial [Phycisphaerae bacterium]|nr:hypothetical protein [Phycisphaerae bacterium]